MSARFRVRLLVATLVALLAIPALPGAVAFADSEATTTAVSSSANPSTYGDSITFTAIVSTGTMATPTGTVQFKVDDVDLGAPVTLVDGTATSIAIDDLEGGTHTVDAVYASDDTINFANSNGTLSGGQVVQKAAQATLTVNAVSPAAYGSVQTMTTSGGNGTGAVTYSDAGSTACSVSGDELTITAGTGSCAVTATKAADANYNATTSVAEPVTVQKAAQAVSFTTNAPANARVGGPTYAPAAAATSGLPVTISRASASSGVCSISGGDVSFIGAGTCTLHADQAGNGNYDAAPQGSQAFTVSTAEATTTAVDSSLNPSTYGVNVVFTATVSAGVGTPTGTVQFKVDGVNLGSAQALVGGVASIGTSALAAGTYVVTAQYSSNDPVNFANSNGTLPGGQVVDKADQATLTITAPTSATYGAVDATITTAGGSGTGAVTFDADSSPACSIVTGKLHVLSGTGSCAITATKAGDANYNPTTSVPFSVTVQKSAQAVLSVTAPASAIFGATDATITTSGGSGSGAVTFDAGSSTACSIVAGKLHVLSGTGTCAITATKAADDDYNATTSALFSVTIDKAAQATLTVNASSPAAYGSVQTLTASGGSGTGAVTFSDGTSSACSVVGDELTITAGTGTCAVTATKAADDDYDATTSAAEPVTVQKAAQATLTITGPATKTYGDIPFAPVTSGGSGTGTVTFTSSTPAVCTASSSASVTIIAAGTCTVTATMAGDADYNPTTSAPFSVTVQKAAQATLTVNASSPAAYGSVQTLTITGGSGTGAVTYSTGSSTACSVSANQLMILASVGTCAVTATKAADANYNARSSAPASITVIKASTTLTLASDNAPSVYGESVTFTATVAPVAPGAGTPSGTVQFRIDGLDAGAPVTLAGGTATFSTSTLAAGSHTVLAVYGGDASFVGDTGTLAGGQTVAKATLTVTADPVSREFGAANPTLTASYAGFMLGDTFGSSVTGSPVLATTATPVSSVLGGPYPITVDLGSLAAANYDFTPVDGLLSVLPATTTLDVVSSINPAVPSDHITLTATLAGFPTATGSIDFQAWDGASFVTFESVPLTPTLQATTGTITLPGTEGDRQYRAVFTSPDPNYASATGLLVQGVGKSGVTVTLTASRTKWESTVPVAFTATITPIATNATVAVDGTVDFSIDGGPAVTVPVADGTAILPARLLPLGTSPVVTAVYSGNGSYLTGAAAPLGGPVTANLVEAAGVAASGTTIYPYKDSWRDTVAIHGTRTERLSVAMRFYKPNGSLLMTRTVAAGTGAYSYTWNGRYSSGKLLPAGKYKVVQTLTDWSSAPALAKSWTSYVTLSSKKMTWHTVSVYRNANAPSAWSGAPSLLSSSKYSTGARLITPTAEAGGWAAFAYQFTLPSASTIKSVAFYVQGGPWSGGTPNTPPKIGLHDWRTGTSWLKMYDAARARKPVGTSTSSWYGIGGDPAVVVKSISGKRYVRAFVDTGSWVSGFRYDLGKVRVVVTYGVLK